MDNRNTVFSPTIPLPFLRARHLCARMSRRHDTLAVSTSGVMCVKPTVPRGRHQSVRVSRRHETSPSHRLFDIRPIYQQVDIAALERDPCRVRIQLVVRSFDRLPHQLSAYSIQQIDAKGIVDFVDFATRAHF